MLLVAIVSAEGPLDRRLAAIRVAFLKNDASLLAEQFPARDKVYLALPDFGVRSFLGPGPLRALLERLAAETSTTAFVFDATDQGRPTQASDSVWIKARWTYRDLSTGSVRLDELHFSIRRNPEDGEWRIAELRASR
ncbi:MAG: hypothetical protein HYX76_10250 [Acidobacteria bacterium]|nr:hypothetical protein [Acidobacteriota bacterium]